MREPGSNQREQTKEPLLQHGVTVIVLEVKVKMKKIVNFYLMARESL